MDQTADDYEIIVVDDSSTDVSHEMLDLWDDKVQIIRNRKNLGLGASCNAGIRQSLARYVVRVDADDYVCKDFVYLLSRFLDYNPLFEAVKCDYYTVTRDHKMELVSAVEKPIACGIMYRREVLWELGMYDETPGVREDVDIRERFDFAKFRMGHLQLPLYRYHRHPGSITFEEDENEEEKEEKSC